MKVYDFLNNFSNLVYYSKDNKKAIAFGDIRFLEEYKDNNPSLNYSQIIKKIYDEKKAKLTTSMIYVVLGTGNLLFLKYEFGNDIYLLNKHLSIENQKQILVKKIGNLESKEAIKVIKDYFGEIATPQFISSVLTLPNVLKELGVIDDNYTIIIENNGKEEEISLTEISNNIDNNLFYKKHEKNPVLEKLKVKEESKKEYRTNNSKLDYASDSNIKLLKLLSELSINIEDKTLFEDLYNNFKSVNKITLNKDTNTDWMIIISYFLLNEDKRINLPNNYGEYLSEFKFQCYSVLDDEIDYNTLVKYVRNSFAHSSYEVIDDKIIRIYSYNKKTKTYEYDINVSKLMVLKILEDIELFGNLNTHFPMIVSDFSKNFEYEPEGIKNKQELIKYLKSRKVIDCKQNGFKENFDCGFFKYRIAPLINDTSGYNYHIDSKQEYKLLEDYFDLEFEEKLINDDDINYLLHEIDKLGTKFYEHSFINKNIIIANIYRTKKIGLKVLNNEFLNTIKTENKLDNSLLKTLDSNPTEFYRLQNYLQILVISYLNNLLLYSYNENEKVDPSQVEFVNVVDFDKNIIKAKNIAQIGNCETRINKIRKEVEELNKHVNNRLSTLSNPSFLKNASKEKKKNLKNNLKDLRKELKKYIKDQTKEEAEIITLRQGLLDIDSGNYNFNKYILKHLRNSLAHGYFSFPNGIDINDISNVKIKFEDFAPDTKKKTFEGEIILSDFLKQLSNKKYLKSIYFKNSHFKKKK